MKKVELINDIINRFTTDDIVLIDKKYLMYLFDSKSINEIKYTSNVDTDIKGRMNFIINTFNRRVNINEYTRFIMLLKSSSSYPLLIFEVAKLNNLYSKLPKDCRVAWGVGTDESLNKDLSIDIIASK